MKSRKAIITTSWDDGHPLDIKLAELLKKYSIKGTFYVPIRNWANDSISVEGIKQLAKDFEIGGHTYNHAILTQIPEYRMDLELIESKKEIEKILDKKIISFCYPLGQFNDTIKDLVKKAGYVGARTAKLFRINFEDNFEFDPTIHAANRKLISKGKGMLEIKNIEFLSSLLLKGKIFKTWDKIANESLMYVLKNGGIWHLWGHSWEIEQDKNWEILEDVLKFAQSKGQEYGAEFLTNGEILKRSDET